MGLILFLRIILSFLFLGWLTGCNTIKSTLGFDHEGPNEFEVVPLAPLSLPRDFGKTPSTEKKQKQADEMNTFNVHEVRYEKVEEEKIEKDRQKTTSINIKTTNIANPESFAATNILLSSEEEKKTLQPDIQFVFENIGHEKESIYQIKKDVCNSSLVKSKLNNKKTKAISKSIDKNPLLLQVSKKSIACDKSQEYIKWSPVTSKQIRKSLESIQKLSLENHEEILSENKEEDLTTTPLNSSEQYSPRIQILENNTVQPPFTTEVRKASTPQTAQKRIMRRRPQKKRHRIRRRRTLRKIGSAQKRTLLTSQKTKRCRMKKRPLRRSRKVVHTTKKRVLR